MGLLVAAQSFCPSEAYARKEKKDKKTLVYVIGDSTVKNGQGRGDRGQWGWGSFIGEYFDDAKAEVRNRAIGGRSSRTFITEGRWNVVCDSLRKGDYVIIQFGHNDGGELFAGNRPRASLKGFDDRDTTGVVEMTGREETVLTYGAYLRKYIDDARAKGAQPILCTLIPRNRWKNGKVMRDTAQCRMGSPGSRGGRCSLHRPEYVDCRYIRRDGAGGCEGLLYRCRLDAYLGERCAYQRRGRCRTDRATERL